MVKIILFAIIGCSLSVVLKQHCRELVLPFQLGFGVVALVYIFNIAIERVAVFTDLIKSLGESYEIIKVLFKASIISIGVKLGSDICKESGNYLMQDIIELGGRIMIFTLSVPYILQIIRVSVAFLE